MPLIPKHAINKDDHTLTSLKTCLNRSVQSRGQGGLFMTTGNQVPITPVPKIQARLEVRPKSVKQVPAIPGAVHK